MSIQTVYQFSLGLLVTLLTYKGSFWSESSAKYMNPGVTFSEVYFSHAIVCLSVPFLTSFTSCHDQDKNGEGQKQ